MVNLFQEEKIGIVFILRSRNYFYIDLIKLSTSSKDFNCMSLFLILEAPCVFFIKLEPRYFILGISIKLYFFASFRYS